MPQIEKKRGTKKMIILEEENKVLLNTIKPGGCFIFMNKHWIVIEGNVHLFKERFSDQKEVAVVALTTGILCLFRGKKEVQPITLTAKVKGE